MKHLGRIVRQSAVVCLFATFASAQSVDAFLGFGTAVAPSNGVATDTFGTGTLYNAPKLAGLFMKTGASVMFTPHFGAGGEVSWRAGKGGYDGLQYSPLFYDFNAIYHPLRTSERRIVPELQAGLGGMNMRFYESQTACDNFAGCSNATAFVESSNHLQVHFGAGVKIYAYKNFFIRPQADVHYVHNLFQFGSSWVPEYGASVGYTFGSR